MKTEVYSWRVSADLKAELERTARLQEKPIAAILETAVREWLKNGNGEAATDAEEQRRLHVRTEACLGVIAGRTHAARKMFAL